MIETKRLVLRPWTEADAPALFGLARDPEIGPAAGWMPHGSVEESRRIIREVLATWESYAIQLCETGELVGAVGLKDMHDSDLVRSADEYEIGYWTGRPFWGRGYMPEAAVALIDHARRDLGARRIWACHYAGNSKSHRVMEKCGLSFVREEQHVACPLLGSDVFRDQVVMALDLGAKV